MWRGLDNVMRYEHRAQGDRVGSPGDAAVRAEVLCRFGGSAYCSTPASALGSVCLAGVVVG
jgi:hypothetical protein